MFGLFGNNNSESRDTGRKTELIQRWDSFLKKIEVRFKESLSHAEAACMEQLIESDYDYTTSFRTWLGIKAQIRSIADKIDQVWEEKVEAQMRLEGNFWLDENSKGNRLKDKLYVELNRFETLLEGQMSQCFYEHAIQIANQNFECSQCKAALEIQKDLFRSQYVTCHYCNTVNTFEPENKFVEIGWNVISNIAAMNCIEEYDKMQHLENQVTQSRNHNQGQYIEAYKQAYKDYYTKFFKARIGMQPNLEERYTADMERKQKELEEFMGRFNR